MRRVLIFLLLACVCFASGKPIFVKDKFLKNIVHVYTPADDTETYWCKWTLGQPYYNTAGTMHSYTLYTVLYGRPYTGSWQDFGDASGSSNVSNYDATAALSDQYMIYHVENNTQVPNLSAQNSYIEWTIPDNHNRIQIVFVATNNATRSCSVTLSNGSGLTTSTLVGNMAGLWDIVDYCVATEATTTATGRKLRITRTDAGAVNFPVLGIKTFNTNAYGDLTTAAAGIATGHDIISTYSTINVVSDSDLSASAPNLFSISAVSGYSKKLIYRNTTEFTIRWSADAGVTERWTSMNAHYAGTGNANFLLDAEPTLYIDAATQGTMYDVANVAMGELHEADSIFIVSSGYADWDNDSAAREAEDVMEIKITQEFTKAGYGIGVRLSYTGNVTISTDGPYVPSICIPTAISGYMMNEPYLTTSVFGTDYDNITGATGLFVYTDPKVIISAGSSGPMDKILETTEADNASTGNASKKIYFKIEDALLDGAGTPVNGSVWNLSGFISIRSYSDYFNLMEAGKVIKKDPTPRRLTTHGQYIKNN